MRRFKILLYSVAMACAANATVACPACFGKSDSRAADGFNAGIFVMLGVIGSVLAGASVFFVYLARKASATSSAAKPKN